MGPSVRADSLDQVRAQPSQERVPGRMTEAIVEVLEAVEVEDGQHRRDAVDACPLEQATGDVDE